MAELEARRMALAEAQAAPEQAAPLHDFRKQARRVAAQAQLVELYLKPTEHAAVMALTTPLSQGLGHLRDADLVDKRLAALARGKSKPLQDDVAALRKSLRPKDRNRQVHAALRRASPRRLRRPLVKLLSAMQPRGVDPLEAMESRLRQRVRVAVRPGASNVDLHSLRLELKTYRYAREIVVPPGARDPVGDQAHRVARVLGQLLDAHLLEQVAGKATPRLARVIGAAAAREAKAARASFEKGWRDGRWPALQAVTGS